MASQNLVSKSMGPQLYRLLASVAAAVSMAGLAGHAAGHPLTTLSSVWLEHHQQLVWIVAASPRLCWLGGHCLGAARRGVAVAWRRQGQALGGCPWVVQVSRHRGGEVAAVGTLLCALASLWQPLLLAAVY